MYIYDCVNIYIYIYTYICIVCPIANQASFSRPVDSTDAEAVDAVVSLSSLHISPPEDGLTSFKSPARALRRAQRTSFSRPVDSNDAEAEVRALCILY